MAVYEYHGYDNTGKAKKGIIDADSPRLARQKLRKHGIFPKMITEESAAVKKSEQVRGASSFSLNRKVKRNETAMMTRQLGTLLNAGITLVESLTALIEQTENVYFKSVLTQARETINEGGSLADSLRPFPRIFSNLYVNMVAAGESSGTLDIVLYRLADYLEDMGKLRNKIWASLAYPLVIFIMGTLIMSFMVVFVVPKISGMFEDMGQVLPLPTIILISFSEWVKDWWWLIGFVLVGITVGLKRYFSNPKGRMVYHRILLRSPLVGRITRMMAVSRFTKTLSTLLNAGVPLLKSLKIVENIINNEVLKAAVVNCQERVSEGESLAGPLKQSGVFPPVVIHMIAVGEKSGALEEMLLKVSESYDNEVESILSAVTSLLGPIFIVFIGMIILFIALSILLPLFQMNQLVG
jgi:general secretion pathway protein F